MTINSTDITDYLAQSVTIGFEYRSSDEGMTANGSHYQNIIAKKKILTLNFRPLSLEEFNTIETLFKGTDEYAVAYTQGTESVSVNCYRDATLSAVNKGDLFVKGLTVVLKEI